MSYLSRGMRTKLFVCGLIAIVAHATFQQGYATDSLLNDVPDNLRKGLVTEFGAALLANDVRFSVIVDGENVIFRTSKKLPPAVSGMFSCLYDIHDCRDMLSIRLKQFRHEVTKCGGSPAFLIWSKQSATNEYAIFQRRTAGCSEVFASYKRTLEVMFEIREQHQQFKSAIAINLAGVNEGIARVRSSLADAWDKIKNPFAITETGVVLDPAINEQVTECTNILQTLSTQLGALEANQADLNNVLNGEVAQARLDYTNAVILPFESIQDLQSCVSLWYKRQGLFCTALKDTQNYPDAAKFGGFFVLFGCMEDEDDILAMLRRRPDAQDEIMAWDLKRPLFMDGFEYPPAADLCETDTAPPADVPADEAPKANDE